MPTNLHTNRPSQAAALLRELADSLGAMKDDTPIEVEKVVHSLDEQAGATPVVRQQVYMGETIVIHIGPGSRHQYLDKVSAAGIAPPVSPFISPATQTIARKIQENIDAKNPDAGKRHSLRDRLAIASLIGIMAGETAESSWVGNPQEGELPEAVAEQAYRYADAMLQAREQPREPSLPPETERHARAMDEAPDMDTHYGRDT